MAQHKIDLDEFSYLSVLLSVILGLAVTQILKGLSRIGSFSGAGATLLGGDRLGCVSPARFFPELDFSKGPGPARQGLGTDKFGFGHGQ